MATRRSTTGTRCCEPVLGRSLTPARATDLGSVFAALADPIRLRLFSLIAAADEVCACDLVGELDRSQPTISHHTRVLAEAGLIAGDKRGRWVWWHAVPERIAEMRDVLAPAARPREVETREGP